MRRRIEQTFVPNHSEVPAAPSLATGGLAAIAETPPSPAAMIVASETPGIAAEAPITTTATPAAPAGRVLANATDPFPTPKDPFPTPVDPFPTPKDPFPTPVDPFPTPKNPFAPSTNPGTGTPVAPPPSPTPSPVGGNLPVTPAQLNQSDNAVNGPAARAGGLTGAGIRIGIISNSFNVTGGAAADVAQGLLPAGGVTVLEEGPTGSDDEGRAMAELVHATAPGAQLYFYSGFYSEANMAAGVAALQAAGCQIIVDDIGYSDEPMFQNAGPLDTAITAAVSAGVDYFTAAGNNGDAAYQAAIAPQYVAIPGIGNVWAQTFGGATTQTVTVQGGFPEALALQWNAPFEADNADPITVDVLSGNTVVASSVQIGSEPVVEVALPEATADATYSIAILYNASIVQPTLFKYELLGNHGAIDNTAGGEATGAVYGHAMLPGVNAVGAINVADTPSQGGSLAPEFFSSTGGSQFLFAPNGTPLAAPIAANAPEFAAPDGSDTSVFQPFDGTSAAAPIAAATAALMLQADGALSTTDITTLLEDSALPVAAAGDASGAGLMQANLAAQFASTGVIAGSPQTVIQGISQACTIQGGAGNHWLIAGSGGTLIQSQGTDTVQAGAGADTVDLTGAAAALYGGTGATWVRTLGGNDTITGGSGALTVSGGAGGGVIYGSTSGGNELIAGAQQTIILSEGTNDIVAGTGNGDLLYASNPGDDTLIGGSDTEILVGGTQGGGGADVFAAGNGTPLVAPEASKAVVSFGSNDATVLVGSAEEVLQVANGQAGGFDAVYDFDTSQDMLLLSGFGGEQAAAEASITHQYDTGGNSWLKLPDGTVLVFVGLDHLSAANVAYG